MDEETGIPKKKYNKLANIVGFRENLFWILLSLLLLSILSIFSPSSQLNLISYIPSADYQVAGNNSFFSIVTTSLAAILAIIFSISLVTIQHAASKYSPSILEYYRRDKPIIVTYLIFIISIIFSALSLVVDWHSWNSRAIAVSFILMVFCLFLVLFQFWRLTYMVDPIALIKKIRSRTVRNIIQLPKKIQKSVKGVKTQNEFEQPLVKSELYKEFKFHSDESLHEKNKKYILQLMDIIQKSILWREYESCVTGLNAIVDIVKEYVAIRQKDSTPDDEFLQYIYEKLKDISKMALKNEDAFLLREILKAFEKIGCITAEIEVISSGNGSNHITGLSSYHIHQIGLKSIEEKLQDVAAQSVISLGKIGVRASRKNLWATVAVISSEIHEIGAISASRKEWLVVNVSNEELSRLAIHSISNHLYYFGIVDLIIEDIEKLSSMSIENIKGLDADAAVSPIIAPLSDVSAKEMVRAALNIKNEKYPKIETRQREEYVKDIISKIIATLCSIGINAAKFQSWGVLNYTNDTLREIGLICVDETFITFKENLEEELINLSDSLEEIYMSCKDFSSPLPSKISESLAILGIRCIENELESHSCHKT